MWENNTENVESVEHIINPWTQELRKLHKAHKVCYKGSTVLSYYFLFKIYMCGLGQRSFSVEERRFSVFLLFFFSLKRSTSLERQWRDVLQSPAHTAVGKMKFLKPQKEFWGELSTQDIVHVWITNRCFSKDAGLQAGRRLLFHYRLLMLELGFHEEVFLTSWSRQKAYLMFLYPGRQSVAAFLGTETWHLYILTAAWRSRSLKPKRSFCIARFLGASDAVFHRAWEICRFLYSYFPHAHPFPWPRWNAELKSPKDFRYK